MGIVSFYTFVIFTFITLLAIISPFPYSALGIGFVFVGIPLVDFLVGENKANPNSQQEQIWKEHKSWGPPLYFYSITHFILLFLGGYLVMMKGSTIDSLMIAITIGLYTGGLGITVGHELCHKKETLPRFIADILLASVCYQHFAVEHVRGHHLNVSTPEDPASARKNENVYFFLVRTICGSFLHALKIDAKDVIKGLFISSIFIFISAFISKDVLMYFLIQSVVAILLLELVNYVEHYGLSRNQLSNGRYEKVLPIHSWNSSHRFSNYLLFNLQRHSDHHALAHIPYVNLKHHDNAPQLPSGYPGMILLALIPPLWFKIMNPKLEIKGS